MSKGLYCLLNWKKIRKKNPKNQFLDNSNRKITEDTYFPCLIQALQ